jgi:hypothetical protein
VRLQFPQNQTTIFRQGAETMNALAINLERMLCESAISGVDTMPTPDPWTQYGPAGALLVAFTMGITVLFRWAAPLVSAWVLSRVALAESMRKTHEDTAAENRLRFESIERHIGAMHERLDKIGHKIKENCARAAEDSDDELTEAAK